MSEADKIIINSEEDLQSFVDYAIKNINKVINQEIQFEEFELSSIVLKLSDGNADNDSTITGSIMKMLYDFQENIIDTLEIARGSNFTKDEKKQFELRVKVEKGSTNLILQVLDMFKGAITNMPPGYIFGIAAMSIVALTCYKAWNKKSSDNTSIKIAEINSIREKEKEDYTLAMKQLEVEKEIAIANNYSDIINQQIEERIQTQTTNYEKKVKLLDVVEKTTEKASDSTRKLARDLSTLEDYNSIMIDGEVFTKDELKRMGTKEPVKHESKIITISDSFRVTLINFENIKGNALINLNGEKHSFKNVAIPDDLLGEEDYAFLKSASDRIAIPLRLTAIEKNGILSSPTLIGIDRRENK